MKKNILLITIILFSTSMAFATPKLEYFLAMSAPHTHYFEVETKISDLKQSYIDFKMPVWTPGSYLVREYARHVEGFTATDAKNQPLKAEKISKNTWRVYSNNAESVSIKYLVYAFELTVRTSFLDAAHAYLNPASIFMFVDKMMELPSTLTITPYEKWDKITTPLPLVKGKTNVFDVAHFDILVDSPIEIGTHEIFEFKAAEIPHKVAIYGTKEYNKEKLSTDMAKIVEASTAIFGENPCKNYLNNDYTFIVHVTTRASGGLEHLNSTSLQYPKAYFSQESAYGGFLGLVAHEYFHLWNVKRLRPKELGPFDYENENYTTLLWFAEGFTVYYEDVILLRAGLITPEEYIERNFSSITAVENVPGNKVQSASESSWDAWIKGYRPNENSNNATISYYSKGNLIALMLDLEIIQATKGDKNLDDVMKLMYEEYYKKQGRGFTEEEFKQTLEKATGKSFQEIFQKYINATETIDYPRLFSSIGLKVDKNYKNKTDVYFGVSTDANMYVNSVKRGSCAYNAGINVNDEIMAINGASGSLSSLLTGKKVGDKITVKLRRDGYIQEYEVILGGNENVSYDRTKMENPTAEQQKNYQKWLRGK